MNLYNYKHGIQKSRYGDSWTLWFLWQKTDGLTAEAVTSALESGELMLGRPVRDCNPGGVFYRYPYISESQGHVLMTQSGGYDV